MNKTAILKQLVSLANDLDAQGHVKEANEVDALIKKMATVEVTGVEFVIERLLGALKVAQETNCDDSIIEALDLARRYLAHVGDELDDGRLIRAPGVGH